MDRQWTVRRTDIRLVGGNSAYASSVDDDLVYLNPFTGWQVDPTWTSGVNVISNGSSDGRLYIIGYDKHVWRKN